MAEDQIKFEIPTLEPMNDVLSFKGIVIPAALDPFAKAETKVSPDAKAQP